MKSKAAIENKTEERLVTVKAVKQALSAYASRERAVVNAKFFKCGEGEYGHGDRFIGVTVPDTRKVAKEYTTQPDAMVVELLKSPLHEERLLALLIWVEQVQQAQKKKDTARLRAIADLYAAHRARVNNWDLVDLSADKILGAGWGLQEFATIKHWATCGSLWERRIAMLYTFYFIKQGDHKPAYQIAQILLHDPHDLIQKAVGWMLREVGKQQGLETLERFLSTNYRAMPRTALRYAIERLPEGRRQMYMRGRV